MRNLEMDSHNQKYATLNGWPGGHQKVGYVELLRRQCSGEVVGYTVADAGISGKVVAHHDWLKCGCGGGGLIVEEP